jgi:hypothetical protein
MKVYTTLLDSHLYVFSKWVLDLLAEDKEKKKNRFRSVKGDFVPYLVSCQGSAAKQASMPSLFSLLPCLFLFSLFYIILYNYNDSLAFPPTANESQQSLALSMSSTVTDLTPSGRGSCYASCIDIFNAALPCRPPSFLLLNEIFLDI